MLSEVRMATTAQHATVPVDNSNAPNILRGVESYSGCIDKAAKLEAERDYEGAVKVVEAGMKKFPKQEDLLSGYLNSLLSRIGCNERTLQLERR